MKRLYPLFTTFLLLTSSLAYSQEANVFFWDNQQNFVTGENCELIPERHNPFRVSTYYGQGQQNSENLRNFSGVRQSNLVNHSLAKIVSGRDKTYYESIEIIGVNKDRRLNTGISYKSQRGDHGYLHHRSLLPAEDFFFSLNSETENIPIGNIRSSATGTLWRLAADDSFYSLKCANMPEERTYSLFKVFAIENQNAPIAFVGISNEETKILSEIITLTKNRASDFVLNILRMGRIRDVFTDSAVSIREEIGNSHQELEEEVIQIREVTDQEESTQQNIASQKQVICSTGPDNRVNIRNEALSEILFQASLGEEVTIFQSWDGEQKVKRIGGVIYQYVRIQFKNREEEDQTTGWIARAFVKKAGDCRAYRGPNFVRDLLAEFDSILDDDCCEFPLESRPTHPYTSGMRRFNAGRGRGTRSHAACDLYLYLNEPVLAVAPGKVVSEKYHFYQGTYAIEVEHPGGYIARYGEITGRSAPGTELGAVVEMGQRLGYIGKVNSNCCRPMLHFELYEGTRTGALTQGKNRYRRRTDLMNPTDLLLKWEEKKF